ncbi:hypothetical protein DMH17_04230 [Raoultella planticola]|nr:hypothetical protein [Raoultella planticola]
MNINNFSLAMINPISPRGEKAEGKLNANLRLGGDLQSPQLFGQMQLGGIDIDGNFMPFDMQPSQLVMNFNGTPLNAAGHREYQTGPNQSER